MKVYLALVVFLCLALVAQAMGPGKDGDKKGDKQGMKPRKKGPGRNGNGFRGPKFPGIDAPGVSISLDDSRVKVLLKGGVFLIWKELTAEKCKNPMGSETTDGAAATDVESKNGTAEDKGCPSKPTNCRLLGLYEVDAQGVDKTEAGHSYDKFGKVDVTCDDVADPPELSNVPNTIKKNDDGTNSTDPVQGVMVSCSLSLGEPAATVKFSVYLINDNGFVGNGDESSELIPGQMKLSMKVSDWVFLEDDNRLVLQWACGSKGKPRKKEQGQGQGQGKGRGKKQAFTMDDDAELAFSGKVKIDGEWQDLPKDIETGQKGSHNIFNVTVNKFTTEAFYDPDLISGDEDDDSDGDSDGAGTIRLSVAALIIVLLASILGTY